MAHGIKNILIKKNDELECNNNQHINNSNKMAPTTGSTKMGSRRIFTPQFKLQVLESYRIDNDCKGNQRATARKYGIHRRQIQKWLQCEDNLKSIIANNPQNIKSNAIKSLQKATAPILSSSVTRHRVGTNNLPTHIKEEPNESAVARLEGTYQQQQQQHHHHHYSYVEAISPAATPLSPHFTDISNSYLKPESRLHPIDLSVPQMQSHKRKHSLDEGTSCSNNSDNKKPIKLFKPYLEENFDIEIVNEAKHEPEDENKQNFPLIWITRSSSTLSSPTSGTSSNSYYTLMPPSQASPVSGYDSSTSSIYSFNDTDHEVSQVYSSGHYDVRSPVSSATTTPHTEIEVPLSTALLHDLKFKLHALDCYYNDASCKRNEKLVANKLNINCKIIEKWLRQENDLRHQQQQHHLQILV
ncbi:unnamed protein product [Diamesa tonsa]